MLNPLTPNRVRGFCMSLNWDQCIEIYLSKETLQQKQQDISDSLKQKLLQAGDQALEAGPFSVMDKNLVAPSGDKHDFLRGPTYAWPNPDTPDGLPYINKDGEAGPAVRSPDYDQARLGAFTSTIKALAWSYFASAEERYAQRAIALLKTWFIDDDTKMNPNLTYSKATPGMQPPYPTGVIATHVWVEMVQGIGVLACSEQWTSEIAGSLKAWFADYLNWLQSSDQGLAELSFDNNRGVWYDAQLIAFALFVGDDALVKKLCEEKPQQRIDQQVAADGTLPRELGRTKGLSYSIMTLQAFSLIGLMAERFGNNIWTFETSDGRSLRLAIDFISPYLGNSEAWPYQQINPIKPFKSIVTWLLAARHYSEPSYHDALLFLSDKERQQDIDYALFA